jgi:hypothetical protein
MLTRQACSLTRRLAFPASGLAARAFAPARSCPPRRSAAPLLVRAMTAATAEPAAAEAAAKPQPIFRKDYTPTPYLIDTVSLNFDLREDVTTVTSTLALTPNYTPNGAAPPLFLNGRPDVKLLGLKVAGKPVPEAGYALTARSRLSRSPSPLPCPRVARQARARGRLRSDRQVAHAARAAARGL